MSPALIDLSGKTFGGWTVVAKGSGLKWVCRCQCGVEREVFGNSLRHGKSRHCNSCGSRARTDKRRRTHGRSDTSLHVRWLQMRSRCNQPGNPAYDRYGGRGIQVYPEWDQSFEAFAAYVGEPPPGMTLDRIDNNGHYEPGNVRWATRTEQVRNRRNTRTIKFEGQIVPLGELCERFGRQYDRVKHRLRLGWTIERALDLTPKSLT